MIKPIYSVENMWQRNLTTFFKIFQIPETINEKIPYVEILTKRILTKRILTKKWSMKSI